MFTGLIEAVGTVLDAERTPSSVRLRLRTALGPELHAGDSLAVNGVCLTVVAANADVVEADIGPETERVSTLASLQTGESLNLERPMRADGRFGGHFVQGHVDSTGVIERISDDGEAHWVTIGFGAGLAPYLIAKGSVAVDGISLTVAALRDRSFDVMIVPFTWEHTTLRDRRPGDRVNLECDMVGKYVARAVEQALVGPPGHRDTEIQRTK